MRTIPMYFSSEKAAVNKLDRVQWDAINVYVSAFWPFIWSGHDLDIWPFDLEIQLVHLRLQMYQSCKFGKIPVSTFMRCYIHKITSSMHTQTDNPKKHASSTVLRKQAQHRGDWLGFHHPIPLLHVPIVTAHPIKISITSQHTVV